MASLTCASFCTVLPVQGLVKAQHGAGSSSSSNAGDSGALSAPLQQQSAAGRQEFPEKRKTMFCYKAPSDSLLIQVRLHNAAAVLKHGRYPDFVLLTLGA